jgi:hypothetical protein
MRKVIFIVFAVVFLGFIGRCVYMVLCISCPTPEIKVYEYSRGMNDLEMAFKKFAS